MVYYLRYPILITEQPTTECDLNLFIVRMENKTPPSEVPLL